jgi:superfamily I DNA/RNA helicase
MTTATAKPFIPSAAQQAFFDFIENGSGSALLEAVAGAGKTTTCLQGISRMPGSVWMGVYNKKNAEEMKARAAKMSELAGRPDVSFSTFHAAGFQALRMVSKRVQTDQKKVQKILDNLILEREAADKVTRYDLRDMEGTILKIISMAKNRGIGAVTKIDDVDAWYDMISHFDLDAQLPEEANLTTAVAFARTALARSNNMIDVIDFDDMVYLPLVHRLKLAQNDWVIVDEAQDTNPTRRALAGALLAPGGRLIAVGDPHQAIYGFTGADNDALDQLGREHGAIRLPLSVSYRCPRAVIRHAQRIVSHIESHEDAIEGSVTTEDFGDFLADLPHTPKGEYAETAILCRNNKYLVSLAFKMIRMGLPARMEGRAIGDGLIRLCNRWNSVKTLVALENKLNEYLDREVAKFMDRGQEDKADRLNDQVETLFVIMDRARAQGMSRVEDMVEMIRNLFTDGASKAGCITLASCHRAKGLEWNNVYLLGRDTLMPSKFAKQAWQKAQEINLAYVAVTRAKVNLIEVTGVHEIKPRED